MAYPGAERQGPVLLLDLLLEAEGALQIFLHSNTRLIKKIHFWNKVEVHHRVIQGKLLESCIETCRTLYWYTQKSSWTLQVLTWRSIDLSPYSLRSSDLIMVCRRVFDWRVSLLGRIAWLITLLSFITKDILDKLCQCRSRWCRADCRNANFYHKYIHKIWRF